MQLRISSTPSTLGDLAHDIYLWQVLMRAPGVENEMPTMPQKAPILAFEVRGTPWGIELLFGR
jgi:hypothetical protein